MTHAEYLAYLQSYAWQTKRLHALKRAGHHCAICHATERLEVHHNTYIHLGDELPHELTVLCADCHRLYSKRLPVWLGWLGRVSSKIFDGIKL